MTTLVKTTPRKQTTQCNKITARFVAILYEKDWTI